AGDRVSIRLPELPGTAPAPEDIPIEVVYEDEALTVVNKPAGMVTHPAKGNWRGTPVHAPQVHYHTHSPLAREDPPRHPPRPHRDTTGLLVVVKHELAHRRLALGFELRQVHKEYLALVHGVPQRDRDYIERAIGFHPRSREKMAIRAPQDGGKDAVTFYEVVERFQDFALVRCKPLTGRTHQIRIHLTHIGHPILADKLYSGRDAIRLGDVLGASGRQALDPDQAALTLLDRQALHAHRLRFQHPRSGAELDLIAPLPADMKRTLEALRTYRAV